MLFNNAIDALKEEMRREDRRDRELKEGSRPLTRPSPVIRISTEVRNSERVAIRIADNGPGITEEVSYRLFDPFFTTKPVGAGTGLGLSISYQIVVEKHGGQLMCISSPGKGAEFLVEIPLRPPEAR